MILFGCICFGTSRDHKSNVYIVIRLGMRSQFEGGICTLDVPIVSMQTTMKKDA